MGYSTGIDWINYSAPDGTNLETVLPNGFEIGGTVKPLPYYNLSFELIPAGRVDLNTANHKQGIQVRLTGSDCRIVDEVQTLGSEGVIASIAGKDRCKFTRIDLATDLIDCGANPDDLFDAFKSKQAKTRVRQTKQTHGYDREQKRTGNTVSFGGRGGERYVRVYQKNLERLARSGLGRKEENEESERELIERLRALDYVRVEMELKGEQAKLAAQAITEVGTARTMKMAIVRYINFPTVGWWEEMLNSLPNAQNDLMEGQNHNKGKSNQWLMKQALPAVEKAIREGDWQVITAIERALLDFGNQNFDRG